VFLVANKKLAKSPKIETVTRRPFSGGNRSVALQKRQVEIADPDFFSCALNWLIIDYAVLGFGGTA